MIDVIEIDDDGEDEDEWTEADFLPSDPSPEDRKHVFGPVCPICSKALGAGVNNEALNVHVDKCLRKASGVSDQQPLRVTAKSKAIVPAGKTRPATKAASKDAFATLMNGRR